MFQCMNRIKLIFKVFFFVVLTNRTYFLELKLFFANLNLALVLIRHKMLFKHTLLFKKNKKDSKVPFQISMLLFFPIKVIIFNVF